MVLNCVLNIKLLFEQGKEYAWERLPKCRRCGSVRIWGHGFVLRWLDGFSEQVWVKRYRCADCHCVYTMRPKGFWKRFQASVDTIVTSIKSKLEKNQWLPTFGRQRQQYWFQGFKKQCARIGERCCIKQLRHFLDQHSIVSTHSVVSFSAYSVN
jgi:hypothetical protein